MTSVHVWSTFECTRDVKISTANMSGPYLCMVRENTPASYLVSPSPMATGVKEERCNAQCPTRNTKDESSLPAGVAIFQIGEASAGVPDGSVEALLSHPHDDAFTQPSDRGHERSLWELNVVAWTS